MCVYTAASPETGCRIEKEARTKVQDDVKHRLRDVQGVELPLQLVTSESVTHHATRSRVKKNETVDRFLRSGLRPGLV
jgi:hypothetical protein